MRQGSTATPRTRDHGDTHASRPPAVPDPPGPSVACPMGRTGPKAASSVGADGLRRPSDLPCRRAAQESGARTVALPSARTRQTRTRGPCGVSCRGPCGPRGAGVSAPLGHAPQGTLPCHPASHGRGAGWGGGWHRARHGWTPCARQGPPLGPRSARCGAFHGLAGRRAVLPKTGRTTATRRPGPATTAQAGEPVPYASPRRAPSAPRRGVGRGRGVAQGGA